MFLASLKTAQFWLKGAPYLAIAAAVLAGWLYVSGLQATVKEQRGQMYDLSVQLKTETAARQRDVAGLTILSSGLVAASSAKQKDQEALSNAIDVQHPQPVSAGLSRLIECLRANDQARECAPSAGTGGSVATPAGSTR